MGPDTLDTTAEIKKERFSTTLQVVEKKNSTRMKHNYLTKISKWTPFEQEIHWVKTTLFSFEYLTVLYFVLTHNLNILHFLFNIFLAILGSVGITAGAHRLWTHKSYKATLPLRILLLALYSFNGQHNIVYWVRDHRLHHKFVDTDADPHNSKRGFFFCHMGWVFLKRHQEVLKKGRELDLSDVRADPVVRFGVKYFLICFLSCCYAIPTLINIYVLGVSWPIAIYLTFFRHLGALHATWSVNSFAHMWGTKPYNKDISSTQNIWVSIFASGEGWHNYHHVFPRDYKANEFSYYLNYTTIFIDTFAKIGWAYDLQQPSKELIKTVKMKKSEYYNEWDAVDLNSEQNMY